MGGLAGALRQAGVVGAGGAGFPTYIKLSTPVEYLIANGAECEPLLHKDQALLAGRLEEIMAGLRAAMAATGAKRGLLAVKAAHAELLDSLRRATASATDVEIRDLPDIYPAGDEVVLVYELLSRIVPAGSLPGKVGALIDNVETLHNIGRALQGEPVTDKYLTVTGRVKRPVTLKLPIGTAIAKAIDLAGGALDSEFRVLVDGPMMGTLAEDLQAPVTKTTSALIVLPVSHHLVTARQKPFAQIIRLARSVCTSCTFCTETCPRRLLGHPIRPHLIMRAIGYQALPERGKEYGEPLRSVYRSAHYCVGCGTCNLVCPMGLQPRAVCTYIKSVIPPPDKAATFPEGRAPLPARESRRMPASRLYQRLGLDGFRNLHPVFDETAGEAVGRVRLRLRQGIGAPCVPMVREGQRVEKGEPVAQPPPDGLGVVLHASIAGVIVGVTDGEIAIEKRGGMK